MRFLLRTLSVSYLTRHVWKAVFAVVGISIGVATFVSIKSAQYTLVAGFRSTIDRLAGRSQIQITGVGGVPEGLRDTLRDLAVVDVEEPIIEQVVQPEAASLGTLLVIGIDLIGDHHIRDYAFDGDDADVDDPLVFLAQPDSVALSRDFARRAGVRSGDAIMVRVGGATRRLAVRALLEPKGFARAYGGNVAITDVYAAQLVFGRGRSFDRIDVRLRPAVSLEDGLAAVTRAVGPGFRVDTPERRGAQVEAVVTAFTGTFDVLSVVALGIGLYMIFNVFTVAVQRRRRDIGILRALGATPRQVRWLFLAEAALLGTIGSALGVFLGTLVADRFLGAMGAALASTSGLSEAAAPALTLAVALEAVAIGVCASLVGAWMPARDAGRVPPTTAIATGVFNIRTPIAPWQAPVGLALIAIAFALGRFGLVKGAPLVFLVSACGAVGTTVLAGPTVRTLIRPIAPLLARLSPVSGRIAGDSLLGHARRTSGTAAVLTVSMAFVLGMAGYLQAVRVSVGRWAGDVMTADLFVRASTGLGPSAIRLPYDLRSALLDTPGVAAVDGFRNERVIYGGQEIALVALDARGVAARTHHEFVAGDDSAFRTGLPDHGQCVVSDNFARRFHLGVGDVVTLDSPTGPVRLPIAAIVINFISDRGTVMIDRSVFANRWKNDQVDAFHVALAPGAAAAQVREALRARWAGRSPALISTRAEFIEEVDAALASLQVVIRAVVTMALVIALMGVMTSLWVSVVERTRDIGVLKALGARHYQIGGAVVWEAVTLAVASLGLAVPLGSLLAWFLRARVSENYAGFRFPAAYPTDTLLLVLAALPLVAVVAAWMPARWAAGLKVTEAISYE